MTPSSECLGSTRHVGAVIAGAKGRHHDRPRPVASAYQARYAFWGKFMARVNIFRKTLKHGTWSKFKALERARPHEHEKCARRAFAHHCATVHFRAQPLQRSAEDIKPATDCRVSILSRTFYTELGDPVHEDSVSTDAGDPGHGGTPGAAGTQATPVGGGAR